MHLVYLSPVQWASFTQRPHKFVNWFHKRTGSPVLWIDPYPTRFPITNDIRRLKKATSKHLYIQPSWLKVLRPTALPIEPLPGSGLLNGVLWKSVLKEVGGFISGNKATIAIGKPSVLAATLLNLFDGYPSLYDAMDNFPAFYNGLSRIAMSIREKKIIKQVDTVWATSTALKDRLLQHGKDVKEVFNGLDTSVMPTRVFPRKEAKPKVFGYVGTIAQWFDWCWIYALAKARTQDIIRLIGPVFHPPHTSLPPNIEILPACDHEAALKAMQYFDVGLIPFKLTELTDSVDPIKYYEYRASGLPVISTNFGEMRYRAKDRGVFISDSEDDIVFLVECAMYFSKDVDQAAMFAQLNSWESRFDQAALLP